MWGRLNFGPGSGSDEPVLSITDARSIVVALALAAPLLGACAGEEEGFAPCDVRGADCQARIFRAVVALRGGGDMPMPKISVVDEAGLMAHWMADTEEQSPEEEAAAERAYAQWNRGLSLFGLAPAMYDAQQATQDQIREIAGIYDTESKAILIVDRGDAIDSDAAVLSLAHEFVHALQDAQHDLAAFQERWGDSFDAALATASIIEGEAVMYQLLASAELRGLDVQKLAWQRFFDEFRGDVLREAEIDRVPLTMARLRFPYAFGGGFVTQHWLARGPAGIDALFAEPPLTTHAVMFGSVHGTVTPDQVRVREGGVPMLDPGFEEVASTALGAWIQRIFAARMGTPIQRRGEAARALRADWFSVQADGTDRVVAAWRERGGLAVSALDWPGRNHAAIEFSHDPALSDYYLVAGDLPEDFQLGALAWRMPATEGDDEGDMTAALRDAHPSWLRAIPCRGVLPRVGE